MKLNIGCGTDIKPDWVNLDLFPSKGVDIVADITKYIPLPDNSVRYILASHVLEHCFEWENAVLECYRVLLPGGILEIRVPYGITYTAWHRRFFREESLDGFLLYHKNTPNTSYQRFHRFVLDSRSILYAFPFAWHIKKYLHINPPIGRKSEITWILRKPKHWRRKYRGITNETISC